MRNSVKILWVIALVLCGCVRKQHGAKLDVAVSVEPQRWLVEQVGGERVHVVSLLGKNADPESFDPTVGSMRAVGESDVFFITGTSAFEKTLIEKMSLPEERTVDLSAGIEPVTGTHHHHDHGEGCHHEDEGVDPHMWVSVRNLKIMAEAVTEALCKADPEGAAEYERNSEALIARLDSADREFSGTLAKHKGAAVLMWHPALSYFTRDYGLEQIALGAEGKEASVLGWKEALQKAKEHDAVLFVVQPQDDRARTATVMRSIGADTVNVNTLGYDILGELGRLLEPVRQ